MKANGARSQPVFPPADLQFPTAAHDVLDRVVAEAGAGGVLLDALMERHLATLEKVCRAVGDVADILRFGDDLGTNGGPFISPTPAASFSSRATPCSATMYTGTAE